MRAVAPPMMLRVTMKAYLRRPTMSPVSRKQRAEWAHQEADGERGEICDVGESFVAGRIKFRRKDSGEAAENIEVRTTQSWCRRKKP